MRAIIAAGTAFLAALPAAGEQSKPGPELDARRGTLRRLENPVGPSSVKPAATPLISTKARLWFESQIDMGRLKGRADLVEYYHARFSADQIKERVSRELPGLYARANAELDKTGATGVLVEFRVYRGMQDVPNFGSDFVNWVGAGKSVEEVHLAAAREKRLMGGRPNLQLNEDETFFIWLTKPFGVLVENQIRAPFSNTYRRRTMEIRQEEERKANEAKPAPAVTPSAPAGSGRDPNTDDFRGDRQSGRPDRTTPQPDKQPPPEKSKPPPPEKEQKTQKPERQQRPKTNLGPNKLW